MHIKVGPFPFLLMNCYLNLHCYSAMWFICIFIKIHKNTTNRTCVVCPYCSSSQRSAVVFSAHPALDEQEVLFCITETHIHLQRKIGFGKPKILVTVFQMLKCDRTGNLYKHAHTLLELRRTCAESKKREAHTSLTDQVNFFICTLKLIHICSIKRFLG